MPRNVRNFWLELEVDGKKTPVATGPVAKDGGFQMIIRQRDNGEVTKAGELHGRVDQDGNLSLHWFGFCEPKPGKWTDETILNTTTR